MVLGGTSKSNKSWSLLDMGLSVATGQPWWGQRTTKGKVLYANFELHPWAAHFRLNAIAAARPEAQGLGPELCDLEPAFTGAEPDATEAGAGADAGSGGVRDDYDGPDVQAAG